MPHKRKSSTFNTGELLDYASALALSYGDDDRPKDGEMMASGWGVIWGRSVSQARKTLEKLVAKGVFGAVQRHIHTAQGYRKERHYFQKRKSK